MSQRVCLFCEKPVRQAPAVCRECCLHFDRCKLEIVAVGNQLALCKTQQATLWQAYYFQRSDSRVSHAFQSLSTRFEELNLIYTTRITQLETALLNLVLGVNPFIGCLPKTPHLLASLLQSTYTQDAGN